LEWSSQQYWFAEAFSLKKRTFCCGSEVIFAVLFCHFFLGKIKKLRIFKRDGKFRQPCSNIFSQFKIWNLKNRNRYILIIGKYLTNILTEKINFKIYFTKKGEKKKVPFFVLLYLHELEV